MFDNKSLLKNPIIKSSSITPESIARGKAYEGLSLEQRGDGYTFEISRILRETTEEKKVLMLQNLKQHITEDKILHDDFKSALLKRVEKEIEELRAKEEEKEESPISV